MFDFWEPTCSGTVGEMDATWHTLGTCIAVQRPIGVMDIYDAADLRGGKAAGFWLIHGRDPIPGEDFDPGGDWCQDDHEYYTGTGRYTNDPEQVAGYLSELDTAVNWEPRIIDDGAWSMYHPWHRWNGKVYLG